MYKYKIIFHGFPKQFQSEKNSFQSWFNTDCIKFSRYNKELY